ncbi:hypothetical protein [Candidatus Vallotia lariciata]|nr:hypothetical protein [Candidatus Vallotia lariciata]
MRKHQPKSDTSLAGEIYSNNYMRTDHPKNLLIEFKLAAPIEVPPTRI